MADSKISALTSGNPAQSGDEIPIARGGANYKITAGSIASLGGDVDGPASSVDNQIALFDSTTGKLIKAATTTGVLKASSGVIAAAIASTDYAPATTGTNAQLLANNGSGGFSNVTVGSNLTLSAGTLSAAGGLSWQSVQTTGFTAVAGNAYPCNTTSAAFTVTLPASPSAGNLITLTDYAGTWGTNNLTVNPNGLKINGSTSNLVLNGPRFSAQFVYIDSTQGWIMYSTANLLNPPAVDYLVVAGGGGGGYGFGGGGGAGGYLTGALSVSTGTYTVTVGAGGSGASSNTQGQSGFNSVFSSITSTGGGGGASFDAASTGSNGGSGGGGGVGPSGTVGNTGGNAGTGNTPSTTPSQGNNGGKAWQQATVAGNSGGGGGGANGVGGTATNGAGGAGGAGQQGPSFASAFGGAGPGGSPATGYFSGGGGGGSGTTVGAGGIGGGGAGGKSPSAATAGGTNTGGGGGSGGGSATQAGAAGGSGIVIISYSLFYSPAVATTGSPTVTISGGNRIYAWTGNGSITF